jgi:hypothetical protein
LHNSRFKNKRSWWLSATSSVHFHLEMTLINRLTELNTPMTLFISDGDSSDCSSVPPNILCRLDCCEYNYLEM